VQSRSAASGGGAAGAYADKSPSQGTLAGGQYASRGGGVAVELGYAAGEDGDKVATGQSGGGGGSRSWAQTAAAAAAAAAATPDSSLPPLADPWMPRTHKLRRIIGEIGIEVPATPPASTTSAGRDTPSNNTSAGRETPSSKSCKSDTRDTAVGTPKSDTGPSTPKTVYASLSLACILLLSRKKKNLWVFLYIPIYVCM
jgi:hypothetical protein